MVVTVLLIVSLILFLMAATGFPRNVPFSFGWLGLFFVTLAALVGGGHPLL